MKLLFVSNFFPPVHRGGYEEWCYEVACGLRERGHEVVVLTSRYRREEVGDEADWVYRDLFLEMELASFRNGIGFFVNRRRRERENLERLKDLIRTVSPDAIVVWGMWNLSRSIAALAERLLPQRVIYYLGDYWPTLPSQHLNYWNAAPQSVFTALPKLLLGMFARKILAKEAEVSLQFTHALFCSRYLSEALHESGVSFRKTAIIYGAIDVGPYLAVERAVELSDDVSPFTLLFVGRLHPDKGVHTAIEAVGAFVRKHGPQTVRLCIAGAENSDYLEQLQTLVRTRGLTSVVEFLGVVPKERMPDVYARSDVLLFTSIWPEPFGRTLVEAMASGVAVISTCVGGAGEIVESGVNALTFEAGDAEELTEQIERLIGNPEHCLQLARTGRRTILEGYRLERMVDEIEGYLCQVADAVTA